MQDRVRELFTKLMESAEKDDFVRIDAGRSPEEVQKCVRKAVEEVMERVEKEGAAVRLVQPW